jgi:hypothetical protein
VGCLGLVVVISDLIQKKALRFWNIGLTFFFLFLSLLGDFFSFLERQLQVRSRWNNELANTWFPYITKNIDHVAMVKFAHPGDSDDLTPTHSEPKFRELLGTDEFEGIVVLRWHFARDRASALRQLLGRVEAIQQQFNEDKFG